jgi:hypothetical protein
MEVAIGASTGIISFVSQILDPRFDHFLGIQHEGLVTP